MVHSQAVQADFTASALACVNGNIKITNQSNNATRYEWDFCQGDLQQSPSAETLSNLTANGANVLVGIDFIQDQGNWYGFVCSRSNSTLFRLDFGNSLNNSNPTVTNLGTLGDVLKGPQAIQVMKEGSNFYALVSNLFGNKFIRLSFGQVITSTPSPDVLLTGNASDNTGLDVVFDGAKWIAVLTNNFTFTIINFGNTLSNNPQPIDLIETDVVNGSSVIGDVSLIYDGEWYGVAVSYNNAKVFRLDFGSDLFSVPSITDVTNNGLSSGLNPSDINLLYENDTYQAFITTLQGSVFRYTFGQHMDNDAPATQNLSDFNLLNNTFKFDVVRDKGRYLAFATNWNSNNIFKLNFPELCTSSIDFSATDNPLLKYSSPGAKAITLYSYAADGQMNSKTKTIQVRPEIAPNPSFTSSGVCRGGTTSFLPSDQSLSYNWNFGNALSSTDVNPISQYNSEGEYLVQLEVDAANGCSNFSENIVKIYSAPSANFTPPTGLICTNNEFTFTNNTVDNFDGNLSYQWLVDNVAQSTVRDLKYAFTSGGDKEIKLITSIPGCFDEDIQTVTNVLAGPTVGFSQTGQCESDQVQFTNSSSGTITGYQWDFGNGNTSTQLNPTQVYPTKGTYNVSLITTASNGCASTTIKPLTIYSKPIPNFSLDLPPFSCSGTPSQFNDLTPGPTDSNLSSWAWNFGDAGTSTDRNPLHAFTNAGDYNVSLTAITNFGCSGSFQKSVNIAASPLADFTYTPSCINQGTRFTDASGSGVKSWLWTIGSGTYAFSNPTHVFSSSGDYSAKLTVTGNNNCVATVTKTIKVPVAPSLSFSVDNACETQPANFKDTSPANIDPSASWSWDFAGQGTSTGNATQYSFAKAGSYAVKMTSTQQSGCVYSLSKNVVINTTPVAAFTSSPEWGVPPLSVQFTNTSTGASSYAWHFNDKNNSTSTQTSPGFQFTELGDYVVDLVATSALGCSSSTSGKISVIIPSLDLELKQLQLVKDPTSNVYRIFVTVKNKSNYLLTSVDVVVDISGNALIKETINTNLLPDAEIVQLLNNQILPHGNLLTYLCASIEVDNDNDPFNNSKCEPVEEETVVFAPYPNPSNGTFRFEWISPTTDNAHLEIFNSMGQLTFEQYAETVQVGLNQMQFDLNNLNTGAYYLRFTSNSVSKTLPIQIVR